MLKRLCCQYQIFFIEQKTKLFQIQFFSSKRKLFSIIQGQKVTSIFEKILVEYVLCSHCWSNLRKGKMYENPLLAC